MILYFILPFTLEKQGSDPSFRILLTCGMRGSELGAQQSCLHFWVGADLHFNYHHDAKCILWKKSNQFNTHLSNAYAQPGALMRMHWMWCTDSSYFSYPCLVMIQPNNFIAMCEGSKYIWNWSQTTNLLYLVKARFYYSVLLLSITLIHTFFHWLQQVRNYSTWVKIDPGL